MRPRDAIRLLAAAVAVVLVACGGGTPRDAAGDRPAARRAAAAAVAIRVFRFDPSTLRVPVATVVTWENHDDILHTVTSGEPREGGVPGVQPPTAATPDGRFDGRLDGRGATFAFSFTQAGTYTYFCDVHTGMTGRVVVVE